MVISNRVDVVQATGEPMAGWEDLADILGDPEPEHVNVAPDLTTPAGMLAAARSGEDVTITDGATHRERRARFAELATHAYDATRVSRGNGRERIDFPSGGAITIAPVADD